MRQLCFYVYVVLTKMREGILVESLTLNNKQRFTQLVIQELILDCLCQETLITK